MTSQWRFGKQYFVEEKAEVDCAYYASHLFPNLVDNCILLLPTGFIFQQDGAPAHTARSAHNWLLASCRDFLEKDQWPPNSPDLNLLDCDVWGAMLEVCHKLQTKPKTIAELKDTLHVIWDNLPHGPIDKTVRDFSKRLKACVETISGHFEHSQWQWNSATYSLVNCVVQTMLLNWCCSLNIFNAGKSVGGHVKSL